MAYFDLLLADHAYVFGLLQTDGHHSSGTRGRGGVVLELTARDADVLLPIQALFTCYSSIRTRTRTTNFADSSTTSLWTVCAADFRAELTALGLPAGRKAAMVKPPTVPFDRPGYLRGLLDGDGSVGFTSRGYPFLSFTTASDELAEHFCTSVHEMRGAHRAVRRNGRDSIYNVMVASDPASEMARLLYPAECLSMDRKRQAAQAVASWTRPPTMRARPRCRQPWTAAHDRVVLEAEDDGEAAARLGRTRSSVGMRRWRLAQQRRRSA